MIDRGSRVEFIPSDMAIMLIASSSPFVFEPSASQSRRRHPCDTARGFQWFGAAPARPLICSCGQRQRAAGRMQLRPMLLSGGSDLRAVRALAARVAGVESDDSTATRRQLVRRDRPQAPLRFGALGSAQFTAETSLSAYGRTDLARVAQPMSAKPLMRPRRRCSCAARMRRRTSRRRGQRVSRVSRVGRRTRLQCRTQLTLDASGSPIVLSSTRLWVTSTTERAGSRRESGPVH